MLIVTPFMCYEYELKRLVGMFFRGVSISTAMPKSGDYISADIDYDGENATIKLKLSLEGKMHYRNSELLAQKVKEDGEEISLAVQIYHLLSSVTGKKPPWGILTGVRPTKLLSVFIAHGGEPYAKEQMINKRLLSLEKYDLALKTLVNREDIVLKCGEKDISLYIGIPFCPTRCSYCSFVSHSVDKTAHLIQPYTQKLCEEIRYTANLIKEHGLRLASIYIGGGTPTTLDEKQLDMLLKTLSQSFNLDEIDEYTLEAGRPDTITVGKLRIMKQNKVQRISINPQSMNDEVLKNIGRPHTSFDFEYIFALARREGFDNINTDLIIGLDGDSVESFTQTLERIIILSPENITIHTLSKKRASNLGKSEDVLEENEREILQMSKISAEIMDKNAYLPYYIYRQQNMSGNLENVGYSKKGYEGLYNIYMMEELQSIIACGAGAGSKLILGNKIERVFNFKFVHEYINNFSAIIAKKQHLHSLLINHKKMSNRKVD